MIFKVVKNTYGFYGIECYENEKLIESFPQLSANKEEVRHFAKLINEEDIDLAQLEYFLEDFLT